MQVFSTATEWNWSNMAAWLVAPHSMYEAVGTLVV